MSLFEERLASLNRELERQLRLEQARNETKAILASCQEHISKLKDPAVQQLAREGLARITRGLKETAPAVANEPEKSLERVKAIQRDLLRVIASAEAKARQWSQEQTLTKARVEEARSRIAAAQQTANEAGEAVLTKAAEQLTKIDSLYRQQRFPESSALCDQVDSLIEQASKANLDETVRRRVVGGILSALQDMGFVVEGPQLTDTEVPGGVVVLVGQLPSGKTARFEIQLDGHTAYDLNGYEGRTCAQTVHRVEQVLQEQFGVQLSPPQTTWKNPDRISNNAQSVPGSVQNHRTM